ncbi:hypothetical protein GCM10009558_083760 [Virgisporangium aurantiacum]
MVAAAIGGMAAVVVVVRPTTWTPTADPVARFLVAVTVVLLVCQLLGAVADRMGQPRVLGEVLGGIALGPSVLGQVWPGAQDWIFTPAVATAIGMAAQLGLAVFIFLLGCELRTDTDGHRPAAIGSIVAGGAGLPFVAGLALAVVVGDLWSGTASPTATVFFIGLALSVTAVPVLARILVDLGLEHTRAGTLALASAAAGDGVAWLGLAVILAVSGAEGSLRQVAVAAVVAAGFVLVTVYGVRPLLARLVRRPGASRDGAPVPLLVAVMLGFAAVSQLAGLHVVVGAFLFGAVMPRDAGLAGRLNDHLRGFAIAVLMPLFFVAVGLSTNIGLVATSPAHVVVLVVTLVVAVGTKLAGAGLGARVAGLDRRDALRVGVLMNCRGVTELVVALIGHRLGLINEFGLTVLVLTALLTTLGTAPVVLRLDRSRTAPAATAATAAPVPGGSERGDT